MKKYWVLAVTFKYQTVIFKFYFLTLICLIKITHNYKFVFKSCEMEKDGKALCVMQA